jgi:cellulose synthase/poly-beta-1,6-N-acetylglucosamine synthase-like glycosyltransferase
MDEGLEKHTSDIQAETIPIASPRVDVAAVKHAAAGDSPIALKKCAGLSGRIERSGRHAIRPLPTTKNMEPPTMNGHSGGARLTVIVPHYNSPRTLQRLIESIPALNWVEVVVVDDNSSEPIDELIAAYPNVRLLQLPKDRKGGGAARNFGLENSDGNWLLFADADDFFVDGAFDKVAEYLSSDVDVVYFAPTSLKEATGEKGERHRHYEALLHTYSKTSDKSLLYRYFVPWSKLVARRLVERNSISFDEVIASNDMNFSLKVAFYAQKHAVDMSPIYCVTESNGSLTKQVSLAVLESRFYAVARYNRFLQAQGQGRHQVGINLQIYNMRHLGPRQVLKCLAYSLRHRMPLLRGLKPLARQILKDIRSNRRHGIKEVQDALP